MLVTLNFETLAVDGPPLLLNAAIQGALPAFLLNDAGVGIDTLHALLAGLLLAAGQESGQSVGLIEQFITDGAVRVNILYIKVVWRYFIIISD